MQNALSDTTLYDSGRFPLWFRVPALIFGIGVLWLGAAITADRFLGLSLGMSFRGLHGSALLASLGCLGVAAPWIYVWFVQSRVVFDAAHQELVAGSRGYFRWHERRISLIAAQAIHIHHVRGGGPFGGREWRVILEFANGRTEHLIDVSRRVESFEKSLAATTNLPVTVHDRVT